MARIERMPRYLLTRIIRPAARSAGSKPTSYIARGSAPSDKTACARAL
jgi:hypothetical protein